MSGRTIVGIDAGSAAVSAVAVDEEGALVASAYAFHRGRVAECLSGLLARLLPGGEAAAIDGLARTSTAPRAALPEGEAFVVDGRVAEIEALRSFHPGTATLIVVGAEKFARISFDESGKYRRMRGNSSCAAGTGSFLDQQAARLGLPGGSAELAARASGNGGDFPSIASRCSVFAKTDLIHSQQEGWSVEEICDGLCNGLARNIADTLFPGERPGAPIFMAGGVSRNAAVVRHLSALAGSPIGTDDSSHLYGALGACRRLLAESDRRGRPFPISTLRIGEGAEREYAYAPLERPAGRYPDFASQRRFFHFARKNGPGNPVETDIYLDPRTLLREGPENGPLPILLGFDIGSTSTKAALLSPDGEIIAGLYTRTAGRPLEAAQSICEAVSAIEKEAGLSFEVELAATTGSGRKLVGAVLGADATIDEITAHARAAVELDPAVDTIIEIGGQDSKFTVLRNGIVTFSQMNAVCAAGTGSFLEEQAARLGVALEDFARRATGHPAPLTSDRCTVFMERDLNHLQGLGYATDELLAASLYSVCDNYLGKVAQAGAIGNRIAFQGATAKNEALVAAFERRLGKEILVSKYCHLTGAIGAALQARDEATAAASTTTEVRRPSSFRGFGIHALELPSRAERCGLCANDCRLRVVDVGGEEVAYGFLCGRDYGTKHFVRRDSGDHNLLGARQRVLDACFATPRREADRAEPGAAEQSATGPGSKMPTIGIPSSLYLAQDAPFWRSFFERLGFPCVSAPDDAAILREGKRIAGAEFCAPVAMMLGQTDSLLETSDFVFLPVYLEEKKERRAGADARRYYCNYSQYAPVVARCAEPERRGRILSPLLHGRLGDTSMALDELRGSIAAALSGREIPLPSRRRLRTVYAECLAAQARARSELRSLLAGRGGDDLAVVLIGRPYAILHEAMGKGIADVVARRGVDVLTSDMLPERGEAESDIDPLLSTFHWRYAAELLEAARYCSRENRYYPLLVTSFKCSPDAFALEWFKRILDGAGKPYLILQIDEHDSSVGYETRIEAGLRSFRNHFLGTARAPVADVSGARLPVNPSPSTGVRGKIVLFPNWDGFVCPLLVANLRSCGVDARILEETGSTIRRAMAGNTGQCIPINIIAQEAVEYVERESLDPGRTVLWMTKSMWPCNIPLYPAYIKSIMEHRGRGMERIEVYPDDITFLDYGTNALIGAYHAFLAGGTLRRLACRIRPYEIESGAADRLVSRAMTILFEALERGKNREEAYREALGPLQRLPTRPRDRPKVAIFGDLYVRDNDVLNQDLIRSIEAAGGEVITTSYLEYLKAVVDSYFKRLLIEKDYRTWAKTRAAIAVVSAVERALSIRDRATFGRPSSWRHPGFEERIARFGIRPDHEGECFDNTLKLFRILDEHPDLSLFVQTNPAFCCPSIVTESMAREIERVTGVPIVTITYDGTGAPKNDAVVPHLAFSRRERE